ncbi:MAG: tetratricopeptide repeat protein [Verrucomicrobiales bacterium]
MNLSLTGRLLGALILGALAVGSSVRAHEDILLRIGELNEAIERDETSPELLVSRAALYLAHKDWNRSLADYRAAIAADPDLAAAHLGMARCYLGKGKVELGLAEIGIYLKASGDDHQGLLTRARLRVAQGQLSAASADYRGALAQLPGTEHCVEIYFEWANHLSARGAERYAEALHVLDAAAETLGQNIALQELAIRIELSSGNPVGALTRIDSLLDGSLKGSPAWTLRRAEILQASGKTQEALEAYRQTLASISKIPARRRMVTAIRTLEEKATAQIAKLES